MRTTRATGWEWIPGAVWMAGLVASVPAAVAASSTGTPPSTVAAPAAVTASRAAAPLVSLSCGIGGKPCKADDTVTIGLTPQGPDGAKAAWLDTLSVALQDEGPTPGPAVCLDLYRIAVPAAADSVQFRTSLLRAFDDGNPDTTRNFRGRLGGTDSGTRPMTLVFKDQTGCPPANDEHVLTKVPVAVDFSGFYADGRWPAPALTLTSCSSNTTPCRTGDTAIVASNELRAWLQGLGARSGDVHLFVDGIQLPSTASWARDSTALAFRLDRSFPSDPEDPHNTDSAAWVHLFALHPEGTLQLPVALGRDGPQWPVEGTLQLSSHRWPLGGFWLLLPPLILIAALIAGKTLLARDQSLLPAARSAMAAYSPDELKTLRASCPSLQHKWHVDVLLPPVSLSTTLTMWWSTLIVLCCLYAYWLTGSLNVINATVGSLLGTSILTCAGASLANRLNPDMDGVRRLDTDLASELAAQVATRNYARIDTLLLRGRQQLLISSPSVFTDLFCECDRDSVDTHRVQVFVASILVALWYVAQINRIEALPALSDTMLSLFGISNGAYLGFKLKAR